MSICLLIFCSGWALVLKSLILIDIGETDKKNRLKFVPSTEISKLTAATVICPQKS